MAENDEATAPATRTLMRAELAVARKLRCYRFVVSARDGRTWSHRVDSKRLRVGTHEDNHLVLDDPAVSRLHFEVTADDRGFRLRDLVSRNGTHIDGMGVVDVYLRDAVTVNVGRTKLRFELLAEETDLPLLGEERFGGMVGRSVAMRELFALLEKVSPTDATVLITGENGTGKELVARAIHAGSRRSNGPWVVFDCAAVSGQLLESELFGHEKGAFTGASGARAGAVEEADGGTLFLDELGELPLELQPKLLRLLQEREVRRLGSNEPRPVDVRIVAATNRDLATEISRGAFRTDLFYRVAVVQIESPALRDRLEDIPLLVRHFALAVTEDGERAEAVVASLGRDDWKHLSSHAWPGNVRELGNLVTRTALLGDVSSPEPVAPPSPPDAGVGSPLVDLELPMMEQKRALVARFEETYLRGILAAHDGNYSRASAAAGVERMYFKRLLKKYQS